MLLRFLLSKKEDVPPSPKGSAGLEGKIAFLEKFKKYSPREEYRLILENAYCERVRVEKELKMIEARVSFPEIDDKDILYSVEGEI